MLEYFLKSIPNPTSKEITYHLIMYLFESPFQEAKIYKKKRKIEGLVYVCLYMLSI